jgi:hypothetical protein
VYILGGVFSHTEGFTELGALWGALAFHALCMVVGTYLVDKATKPRSVPENQPAA